MSRAMEMILSVSGIARRVLVVDDNRGRGTNRSPCSSSSPVTSSILHLMASKRWKPRSIFAPDIALIDIGLPKLNGYEVCRRIRDTEWGKSAMLIAQTGWGRDEDKQLSREAGFDGHLVKPADPLTVLRIVRCRPRGKNRGSHDKAVNCTGQAPKIINALRPVNCRGQPGH